jgi:glyoxylase-like metal-dependent hydrolase (beta-lactamase superfamily II)
MRGMRIHHMNCASMCPAIMSSIKTPGAKTHAMVAHCLLVETEAGLVLVDTGLGLDDLREPRTRLGGGFVALARPRLDEAETAVRRVEQLGFRPSDVRHVIPTHLDLDHAGGLPDFPKAKVHVYEKEVAAALARETLRERERYRRPHFAHGPEWVRYDVRGERWFGFECVRQLEGLPPELLIVPLVGHTRGHSGVAIDTGSGWLLHAGDAYFSHAEMHPERPSCPLGLRVFQRAVAIDDLARVRNRERVRLLARDEGVNVFSAHDAYELERFEGALV